MLTTAATSHRSHTCLQPPAELTIAQTWQQQVSSGPALPSTHPTSSSKSEKEYSSKVEKCPLLYIPLIIVFSLQFSINTINWLVNLLFPLSSDYVETLKTWATFHSDEDAHTLMTKKLSYSITITTPSGRGQLSKGSATQLYPSGDVAR